MFKKIGFIIFSLFCLSNISFASGVWETKLANDVIVSTDNFTSVLSSNDTNVQTALESLDQIIISTSTFSTFKSDVEIATTTLQSNIDTNYAISTTTFYSVSLDTTAIRSALEAEILRSTTTDYNIQIATSALELSKVNRSGDTMIGDLTSPNFIAIYGINAATGTFSGLMQVSSLTATNQVEANSGYFNSVSASTYTAHSPMYLIADNFNFNNEIIGTDENLVYGLVSATATIGGVNFSDVVISTGAIQSSLDAVIASTGTLDSSKVNRAGDTMTGTLSGTGISLNYGISASTAVLEGLTVSNNTDFLTKILLEYNNSMEQGRTIFALKNTNIVTSREWNIVNGLGDDSGDFGISDITSNGINYNSPFVIEGGIDTNLLKLVNIPEKYVKVTGNLIITSSCTATTLDTGQGANELYDMDQNVLTTSDVTFATATITNVFTASTITDGTATLNTGSVTGLENISSSSATITNTANVGTLTDGIITINSGKLLNGTTVQSDIGDFDTIYVSSISGTSTIYFQNDIDMANNNIITNGTIDNRDVSADGIILDAVIISTANIQTQVNSIAVDTGTLAAIKANISGQVFTGDIASPNITASYGITAATSTITKTNSPASSVQILWSTNTITTENDFKLVVSSGGIVDVDTVTAGNDGDYIKIMGTSNTDIVNIVSGGNLDLDGIGGISMALGKGDSIIFSYYDAYWREEHRANPSGL